MRSALRPLLFVFPVLALTSLAWGQKPAAEPDKAVQKAAEKYGNARAAYGVAAAFYNEQNFAKAQEPFEAALLLADDPKMRLDCYDALIACYRLHEKTDKMTTAVEYILDHSDRTAHKSLVCRSYLSFLQQRGKTEEAIKRYEEQLKTNEKNLTALLILSEIYTHLKENPNRAAELINRQAKLQKPANGEKVDVPQQAKLAQQYAKAKNYKDAAELFETIAPLDEKLAAWHYKEAADAWLKLKENDKAKAAALKSSAAKPEERSDLLAYFWNRNLGDILLATGDHTLAIKHYKTALTKTTIEGYVKETQQKMEQAKKAGK